MFPSLRGKCCKKTVWWATNSFWRAKFDSTLKSIDSRCLSVTDSMFSFKAVSSISAYGRKKNLSVGDSLCHSAIAAATFSWSMFDQFLTVSANVSYAPCSLSLVSWDNNVHLIFLVFPSLWTILSLRILKMPFHFFTIVDTLLVHNLFNSAWNQWTDHQPTVNDCNISDFRQNQSLSRCIVNTLIVHCSLKYLPSTIDKKFDK